MKVSIVLLFKCYPFSSLLTEPCHDIPQLANGQTFNSYYPDKIPSTLHGTVVLYYCEQNGFYLEGANRFECIDGVWEPSDFPLDERHPACIAVPEQEAKFFSYSIRTPLQYAVGEPYEYQLTVGTC